MVPSLEVFDVSVTISEVGERNNVPLSEEAIVRVRSGRGRVIASAVTDQDVAVLHFTATRADVAGSQVEVIVKDQQPSGGEDFAGTVVSFRGSGKYCVILPAGCVF
jgi:hypothetical protein